MAWATTCRTSGGWGGVSRTSCSCVFASNDLAYARGAPLLTTLTHGRHQQISGFPASITGCLATLFTKVSVLYFYLRFSTSRRFNAAIYIVLFVVVVSNLLGAFGIVFYCQPMWYFWEALDNPGLTGTCIRADPWYAWLLIINIITDGVLLVLPAWIIYPLRVGFAQKVAIGAILGTGGLYVLSGPCRSCQLWISAPRTNTFAASSPLASFGSSLFPTAGETTI